MGKIVSISTSELVTNIGIDGEELSSIEVVKTYIQRMEGVHDKKNALVIPHITKVSTHVKNTYQRHALGINLAGHSFIRILLLKKIFLKPLRDWGKSPDLNQVERSQKHE